MDVSDRPITEEEREEHKKDLEIMNSLPSTQCLVCGFNKERKRWMKWIEDNEGNFLREVE